MNQDPEVMAEDLRQGLDDHRGIRLAPQIVAELSLDHAERGLDVAPLVVVRQELLAAEHE